ncbi:MAG TPA: hypothetical protein ENI23_12530 [bacterium]|nr:hypothetical protein [bacterium]
MSKIALAPILNLLPRLIVASSIIFSIGTLSFHLYLFSQNSQIDTSWITIYQNEEELIEESNSSEVTVEVLGTENMMLEATISLGNKFSIGASAILLIIGSLSCLFIACFMKNRYYIRS